MKSFSKSKRNTIVDRKTFSWIAKESPSLIVTIFISKLIQAIESYMLVWFLTISFSLRNFLFFFSMMLILEESQRLLQHYSKGESKRLRISFFKQIALKRIELSFDEKCDARSQKLMDYQSQNGGPMLNAVSLIERFLSKVCALLLVLAVVLQRPIQVLVISAAVCCVSALLSLILVNQDELCAKRLEAEMEVLSRNNRKGDYYFSLLSSELSRMKSLKCYNANGFVEGKYASFMDPMIKLFARNDKKKLCLGLIEALFSISLGILGYLASCFLIYDGFKLDLMLALSMTSLASISLSFFRNNAEVKENNQRASAFFDFMSQEKKVPQWESSEEPIALGLEGCSFKYPNGQEAIRDVTIGLEKGRTYCLVGPNGAGKTTLVKIMLGLLEPTKGRRFKSSALSFIPYCVQNGQALSFTVAQNLSMKNTVDEDKAREKLLDMDLDLSLSEKLGKDYGQAGISLSGGNEQRLLCSRAMYFSDVLLVMDEPASSLDAYAEELLYRRALGKEQKRTCLLVSHRLASAYFADIVIVMSNGSIEAVGSHEELLEKSPTYRALYEAQKQHYRA
jgi:ABC-type multidrug transport system fused ATPase/permease subunit